MRELNLSELIDYYAKSEGEKAKAELLKKDWAHFLVLTISGQEQMKGTPGYKLTFSVNGKPQNNEDYYEIKIKELYTPDSNAQVVETIKTFIKLVMSRSKTREVSNFFGSDFYHNTGENDKELFMNIQIYLLNNVMISLPHNDLAFLDVISEACENHYMPQNIDPRITQFLAEQKNNPPTP